jgi:hypothetical protein
VEGREGRLGIGILQGRRGGRDAPDYNREGYEEEGERKREEEKKKDRTRLTF